MNQSFRYAIWGAILGLGSPAGLLVLRVWSDPDLQFSYWISAEMLMDGWVYLYTGIATVLVFSVMGFVWGRRHDLLYGRAQSLQTSSHQLEKLSITDGLTGLYVRRYLVERLDEEIKRSYRYNYPVACLFIDIDDFKSVNEQYGHGGGDKVLAALGRIFMSAIRETDMAGRYGGDEVIVVLPQISQSKAFEVAERIRRSVEALSIECNGEDVHVTVSIGVFASHILPAESYRLFEVADEALSQSKRAGKNRTTLIAAPSENTQALQQV